MHRLYRYVMESPFFVFPVNSRPFGLSYSEWSESWWKWIFDVPKPWSPLADRTGENANVGQSHPHVFYLCQTNEQIGDIPIRKVKVSKNKSFFFPIINWLSVKGVDGENDKELTRAARERMDVVSNLEIIIDGVKLSNELKTFRVASKVFELNIHENNVFDLPSGNTRAVSDGYWLMVLPRNPIRELSSFGSCSSGTTKIAVRYCFT